MRRFTTVGLFCAAMFTMYASTVTAQILAENFRNMDCANCRQPDDTYENFIHNNPNLDVILINYHNAIPAPQDPFYLDAKEDINARSTNFYGISNNPHMFVQGFDAGTTASSWIDYTNEAALFPLPAVLDISKSIDVNKQITVTVNVSSQNNGRQVRPIILLLESKIVHENTWSYGNLPNNEWNNVVRAIAPTASGGDPFMLGGTKEITVTYDASTKNWNMENVYVVAFLQDENVLQGGRPIYGVEISPAGFASVDRKTEQGEFSIGAPVRNSLSNRLSVPFYAERSANVRLTLCDVMGRGVSELYNGFVSLSESSADIQEDILPSGMYFVRMYVDGKLADTEKVIIR